jgi:hypothetical protein
METEKLFVRKASGLVRGMTGTDALIGNVQRNTLLRFVFRVLSQSSSVVSDMGAITRCPPPTYSSP